MNKWPVLFVTILYLACSASGLAWGLYSPQRDQHLFPHGSTWSRERVAQVLVSRTDSAESRGADVDPNPHDESALPAAINKRDEQIAEIYARYLLYSAQPDEMITFRALDEMAPGEWRLDPKLYQYGGLFIYPVGAIIKLASVIGWVQLGDRSHFLNHPDEFARFYLIGRAYVVLWGLLGVWIVYVIGRRLSDRDGGVLAALLFCLLPVVVCLSHEAKPHLPGAVLMLWAVHWAMKYIDTERARHRMMLALSCGLAFGMVLSAVWILILIPMVELLVLAGAAARLRRMLASGLLALSVYGLANPYVFINYFAHRTVLDSNLDNSTAMYQFGNLEAGLSNALALLVEGSSLFIVIGGLVMLLALWGWDWRKTLVLVLPAMLVFAQFAALAAGKPGEYARFAVFPNVVLCILLAAGLFRFLVHKWYQATIYSIALASALAIPTTSYLVSFHLERGESNPRYRLAASLRSTDLTSGTGGTLEPIGVLRDPAPYNFPALDFSTSPIVLLPKNIMGWPAERSGWPDRIIIPINGIEGVDVDVILKDGYYQLPAGHSFDVLAEETPITWANKPLVMLVHRE